MKDKKTAVEWENFTYNVKFIRKYYSISKLSMAKTLKIGVESLSKIENGDMPPRLGVEIFFEIHKAFGIHPKNQFAKKLDENDFKR